MSDYYEAMEKFAAACQDAYILCIKAFNAADNEDGAPASEIAKLQKRLFSIAEDANAIADYGVDAETAKDMKRLYDGAKQAGLV